MATVTGLTAARMLEIEAASIVDGEVVGDNLILTRHDSTTIDAGDVRGATPDLAATSTSSVSIGAGSKTFALSPNMNVPFPVGAIVAAFSVANPANYMLGNVTASSINSVTIFMFQLGGSGTIANWNLALSGRTGGVTTVAGKTGDVALVKADVGLGNVDNTSDANKPVSTATQTELNLKAPLASPAFTGNPTAPTPSAGDNDTSIATTSFVTSASAVGSTQVISYVNGWRSYNGGSDPNWGTARVRKTPNGIVYLEGLVDKNGGNFVADEQMFTLPVGYRPTQRIMLANWCGNNASTFGIARVDILPDGQCRLITGAPANPVGFVCINCSFPSV